MLYLYSLYIEEFKISKGVIRFRKSKKDRQRNRQKKKDKQQSTKHTHKTKDHVTRTPQQIGGELGCSGRVGRSCSRSGTRLVNLVTSPVISHERRKNREVFTIMEHIRGHL